MKTKATRTNDPLGRVDTAVTAAQLLAKTYRDMADEIEFASHCAFHDAPIYGEQKQINKMLQTIAKITGTTSGAVVEALVAAYQGGRL